MRCCYEFLKEHKKGGGTTEHNRRTQRAAMVKQQAANAKQQQQIEKLTAGLQKVSAAVELNRARPTQVGDNR